MQKEYCNPNCPYLLSAFRACNHPSLNGTAKRLQKGEDGHFIRICTTQPKAKKKNKYGAHPVEAMGLHFDSAWEYERYCTLRLLEQVHEISDLKYHEKFLLIPKSQYGRPIYYEADFTYMKNGKRIVEDTKSKVTKTGLYRLKKRLLAEKYGIIIAEIERDESYGEKDQIK